MQEYTVLNLAPFRINPDTANSHLVPGVFYGTTFIQVPAFKDIAFFTIGKCRYIIPVLIRNHSALANQATFVEQMGIAVLNQVVITINIVTVKVTDLVLFTIVNIIQVIISYRIMSLTFCCCPMSALPNSSIIILSESSDIFKSCVLRLVLVGIRCITGSNHLDRFFIICFSIINMSGFTRIIFTVNRFEPDMISPVVIIIRETNNNIVTVRIICFTQDILVQHRHNTLDSTGTLIGSSPFQLGSDHHDEADRFKTICSGYIAVSRPFIADIFAIISGHNEIVVSTIILQCYRLPVYRIIL